MWDDFEKYMNDKYNLNLKTRQGYYNIIVSFKNEEITLYESTLERLEREFLNWIKNRNLF